MAKLIVDDGELRREFSCPSPGQRLTIGRGGDCAIVIQDRKASRQHCEIEFLPDGAIVRDLGSVNGTHVNGQRVEQIELRGGDVVSIGQCRITVELDDGGPTQTLDEDVGRARGVYLQGVGGLLDGRMFPLSERTLVIGRDAACDISIPDDAKVSHRHAEIQCNDGQYFINDLDSTNGTHLNGQPVKFRPLAPDDIVAIGGENFQLRGGAAERDKVPFSLVFLGGPRDGEAVRVRGPVFMIGRGRSNDFVLDAAGVSSLHCTLVVDNGRLLARDNRSTHGTYVNEHRVIEQELHHGNRLTLGDVTLGVKRDGMILPDAAPAHGHAPARPRWTVLKSFIVAMELAALVAVHVLIYRWAKPLIWPDNAGAAVEDPGNLLLLNPSFDQPLAQDGSPPGWQARRDAARVFLHRDESACHGAASFCMTVSAEPRLTELTFEKDVATNPGDGYELRFASKATGFCGVVVASVIWIGDAGRSEDSLVVSPGSDWRLIPWTLRSPEFARQFRVRLLVYGAGAAGKVWLDQAGLYALPRAEAPPPVTVPIPASPVTVQGAGDGSYIMAHGAGDAARLRLRWNDPALPCNPFEVSLAGTGSPVSEPWYRYHGTVYPFGVTRESDWHTDLKPGADTLRLAYGVTAAESEAGMLQLTLTVDQLADLGQVLITPDGERWMSVSPGGAGMPAVELAWRVGRPDQVVLRLNASGVAGLDVQPGCAVLWICPAWKPQGGAMTAMVTLQSSSPRLLASSQRLQQRVVALVNDGAMGEAYRVCGDALAANVGADDRQFCETTRAEIEARAGVEAGKLMQAAEPALLSADRTLLQSMRDRLRRFLDAWQGVPLADDIAGLLARADAELERLGGESQEADAARWLEKGRSALAGRRYTLAEIFFENITRAHPRTRAAVDAAIELEALPRAREAWERTKQEIRAAITTARAEISRGMKAAARARLEKLLAEYPEGEHVVEVKGLLATLK